MFDVEFLELAEANQFYVKNDFLVLKEIELHKGVKSYIYM